jgi:hypothetical protein
MTAMAEGLEVAERLRRRAKVPASAEGELPARSLERESA